MKLLGSEGLKTLSEYLKQTMRTADDLTSAVSGMGADIQGLTGQLSSALQEVEGCLNKLDAAKADIAVRQEFVLAADSWTKNSGESTSGPWYPYCCSLTVVGVTADFRIDAVLNAASADIATVCGLCPTTETADGVVIFRSRLVPEANISGQIYIMQGSEATGADQDQTSEDGSKEKGES